MMRGTEISTASDDQERKFGDNPIMKLEHDRLGRKTAAKEIAQLLQKDPLSTPLVMAVFGAWGYGKTSFLNMLKDSIDKEVSENHPVNPTIWFEAWPYADNREGLWNALFLEIVEQLKRHVEIYYNDQISDSGKDTQTKSLDKEKNRLLAVSGG